MNVAVADKRLGDVPADLAAFFLFKGEELPDELSEARGAADADGGFRKSALIHPESPDGVIVIGLGKRDDFTAERARVAAALAAQAAAKRKATSLALAVPDEGDAAVAAAAVVEGATLASYRFDRYKSKPDEAEGEGGEAPAEKPKLESLTILTSDGAAAEASEAARVASEAANRARELQNLPSNLATPTYLAERALELAVEHDSLTTEVMERDEMVERGMGGLEAVSAGTDEPPKLITIRHEGPRELIATGRQGSHLRLGRDLDQAVGRHAGDEDGHVRSRGGDRDDGRDRRARPSRERHRGRPLHREHAERPRGQAGRHHHPANGVTVEVNNTDAEGRLILADALAYSVELGAERIVDLATLTGAVLVALGSTYAALVSNDDELAAEVAEAGERSGELAWRLPLHQEYKQLTKGDVADLTNAASKRKAGTIYAGSFLEEFVDGKPWAHLDIAGTAWDTGRAYVGKGPTGFGVRLLVDLLRSRG